MSETVDPRPLYIQRDVWRLTTIRGFRAEIAVELGTARSQNNAAKVETTEKNLKALDKVIQDFSDYLGFYDYPLDPSWDGALE